MRGQYFLPMILVAMLVMTAIAMYFSSTNQIHAYRVYSYNPYLGDSLVKAKAEVINGFIESIYNGSFDHLNNVESELKLLAEERAENLTVQCVTSSAGNQFKLDCSTLKLASGNNYATTHFEYTYTVPFAIQTYRDKNMSEETNIFNKGDTVYVEVTGNNSDTINFTVINPAGSTYETKTAKIVNWHWDTSFKPDLPGDWIMYARDLNTSVEVNKTIHYGTMLINITTYKDGTKTQNFNVNDTVNITTKLTDQNGSPVSCPVKVDIVYSDGKRFTSFSGEAEDGVLSRDVQIPENAPTGTMTITATEQCTWYQNSTNITVS